MIYEGDNTAVCPVDIADRVILGLIPTSRLGWPVAARAIKQDKGGVMHIHENITSLAHGTVGYAMRVIALIFGRLGGTESRLLHSRAGHWIGDCGHTSGTVGAAMGLFSTAHRVRQGVCSADLPRGLRC